MTTIQVITNDEFMDKYSRKLGSLLFPGEYYDCKHHTDLIELRKNLPIDLPARAKILRVLVATLNSPEFKNIANLFVPYKHALCASEQADGAYLKLQSNYESVWVTDHPVGDAIVIVDKLR
jgi:hypothetical protein